MIPEQANPGTMVEYWPVGGEPLLRIPYGAQGIVKTYGYVNDVPRALVAWEGNLIPQFVPVDDLQVVQLP